MKLPVLYKTAPGPRQRWYWKTRKDGKAYPERDYLGLTSQVDKAEAKKALATRYAEIKNTPIISLDRSMTFAQFLDTVFIPEAMPEDGGLKKRTTVGQYRIIIDHHIRPFFGDMKLGAVKTFDVNRWLKNLHTEKNHVHSTLQAERGILSAIFSRAEVHELIERNPVSKSELPVRAGLVRKKRTFSREEIERVIAEVPSDLALMIRLGISTGLRISEILALRWKNVDLINGTIKIVERVYRHDIDTPKNAAVLNKVMPLGILVDEMRRQLLAVNGSQWVFPSPVSTTRPIGDMAVRGKLRDVLKKLDLWNLGVGFHSFRRTNISYLNRNFNSEEVRSAVGKADRDGLVPYQILDPKRHAEMVDRIQSELLGKVQ